MAQVKIEFLRSTYGTYKYLNGNAPLNSEDHQDIISLLREVNNATKRSKGRFFTTIGQGIFVIGFISRPNREAVFDLYSTPVKNMDRVDVNHLFNKLHKLHQKVDGRGYEFDGSIDIIVEAAEFDSAQNGSLNSTTRKGVSNGLGDSPTNSHSQSIGSSSSNPETDEQMGSPTEWQKNVAELWQYYRTSGEPLRANIRELTTFCQRVEGALSELSYISSEPGRGRFDVTDEGQRTRSLNYDGLISSVRDRAGNDRIKISDLPTYRDELKKVLKSEKDELSENLEWQNEFNSVVDEVGAEISEEIVGRQVDEAERMYKITVEGELNDDSDQGYISKAKGLLEGGTGADKVVNRILNHTADTQLSEQERRKIAHQFLEESTVSLNETIENKLEEILIPQLQELVRERAKEATIETIDRVDTVRSTKPHEEAHDEFFGNN